MSPALYCVLAAGVLPIICAGISKAGGTGYDNRDPRAWLARQTGWRGRANAAQANSLEAFPFFAAAVLAAQQIGAPQGRVDLLAAAFIAARLAYIACYLADKAMLRSLAWAIGWGLTIALFLSK